MKTPTPASYPYENPHIHLVPLLKLPPSPRTPMKTPTPASYPYENPTPASYPYENPHIHLVPLWKLPPPPRTPMKTTSTSYLWKDWVGPMYKPV